MVRCAQSQHKIRYDKGILATGSTRGLRVWPARVVHIYGPGRKGVGGEGPRPRKGGFILKRERENPVYRGPLLFTLTNHDMSDTG